MYPTRELNRLKELRVQRTRLITARRNTFATSLAPLLRPLIWSDQKWRVCRKSSVMILFAIELISLFPQRRPRSIVRSGALAVLRFVQSLQTVQ